jgi:flagellar biosynthesis protein FlhB
MAEKTEQPTAKRLRDARKKGNIALSREVPAAASFLAGVVILGLWVPRIAVEFRRLFEGATEAAARVGEASLTEAWMEPARDAALGWMRAVGPVLVVIALASVGLALAQAGFNFTPSRLAPALQNMSPRKVLKRWFSLQGVFELLKTVAKLGLVLLIGYGVVKGALVGILGLHRVDASGFGSALTGVARSFVVQIGLVFAAVAGTDYFFQWRRWRKGLMMTKDEVKRELKEQEGDPIIKGQRKALHREMANQQILAETRGADALVVNPTHLAVALRYDRETMAAPRVTARGADAVARLMREEARRHDVPVVRDVPLARALFAVQMGRYVPRDLFEAVAEVLLFAHQLRQDGAAAVPR